MRTTCGCEISGLGKRGAGAGVETSGQSFQGVLLGHLGWTLFSILKLKHALEGLHLKGRIAIILSQPVLEEQIQQNPYKRICQATSLLSARHLQLWGFVEQTLRMSWKHRGNSSFRLIPTSGVLRGQQTGKQGVVNTFYNSLLQSAVSYVVCGIAWPAAFMWMLHVRRARSMIRAADYNTIELQVVDLITSVSCTQRQFNILENLA